MAHREIGQLSLADSLVAGVGKNRMLERLDEMMDWAALARLMAGVHAARYGRKSYPPVAMVKALLLGQWHGLSDPGLEAALADRVSFRRFCGFALDEETPDHVTIFRFRGKLQERGLAEQIFEEVNRQIDAWGVILRRGTLIDATLVEAAVKRPKPPEKKPAAASEPSSTPAGASVPAAPPGDDVAAAAGVPSAQTAGGTPAERPASKLVKSEIDPDAAWAKKGGRRYFGYKGHVGVDQSSGIIRRQCLTPANVNDTVPADGLICGDERAVYADQAYDTKARRAALKARGAKDRLMHRPNKHHPLSRWQTRRNKGIGKRRGPVEQVFACLKRLCGWRRVRYIGLARNAVHLALLCIALNLKRLTVLRAA